MYNLVIHPPATSHTALKRLVQEVVDTHNSASESDIKFSKRVDEDALSVLKSDFFDARGLTHIWHYPHKEYELFIDFILEAKFRYPLKRPYALAKELGIPFHRRKNYIRARGNSYPSAHSASVWFVTYYLADKIPPHLKSELFAFAHKIANSRMVAGVHTRQDLDEGRLLAQKAVNMLKKPRKNDHLMFKETPLSNHERTRISQSLYEIANLVGGDVGFPELPLDVFRHFIRRYGTKLLGVIFDPAEGSKYGPYLGSIAAFDMSFSEFSEIAQGSMYSLVDSRSASNIDLDSVLSKFDKDSRFVYILERTRLQTDYAKSEMAKLNEEFYSYLCSHNYGFVSVCKESTSYKTYVQMAKDGKFKFHLDVKNTIPYLGMRDSFHFIIGEFLP
jgi:hypothetical protein